MGWFGGKSYKFRFYTRGETDYTQELLANIQAVLDEKIKGLYDLEVINVLFKEKVAKEDGVQNTPTLMKILPAPKQKVSANLADPEQLRQALAFLDEKKTEGSQNPPA